MTTQADITLALFRVATDATTLQTDINTLINAIADQNTITRTNPLNPTLIAQINTAGAQITALAAAISAVAGASAV
jgi:hypothetical protein